MKKVVKINIKKTDELPVIAEQVFSAEADEIVLVVPKFSKFKKKHLLIVVGTCRP